MAPLPVTRIDALRSWVIAGSAIDHRQPRRDHERSQEHKPVARTGGYRRRFGGLLAVAVLPPLAGITGTAYLHPTQLAAGFLTAVLIAAGLCADGILAAFTISNHSLPARQPEAPVEGTECHHCALDGPPLRTG